MFCLSSVLGSNPNSLMIHTFHSASSIYTVGLLPKVKALPE